MTNSDSYNGWTNRETWALNLWLTNDRGLYEMTRERVAEAVNASSMPAGWGTKESDAELWFGRVAGETVKAFWEELTDPDEELMSAENILQMVRDVGSEYRVNWDEIGSHFLESGE
jgi:hypothetical protein